MVTRAAENLAELSRRGARVLAKGRHVGVRCCDCGHHYLYDEHHDRLFLDPADLTNVCEGTDGAAFPGCAGCHRQNWSFEDLESEEAVLDFVEGPWGFAFWSPTPAAPRSRSMLVTAFAVVVLLLGVAALATNPDPLAGPGKARPQVQTPGR